MFTPVTDDLDAVICIAHPVPVVQAADVGSGAFVDGDDAEGSRGVEGGQPSVVALFAGQLVAGGRAHQVVSVAGQRPLRVEPGDVGEAWREVAQGGRGRGRVDVDAGQVGGSATDDA